MPSVTADALVFFTVTTCAAVVAPTVVEANASDVGDTVTVSAAAAPVPLSATVCGDPVALSANEIAPVAAPAAAGLKSTETVHVAPAASGLGHVVAVIRKSVDPVSPIVLNVTAPVPVFFTVTARADDVTPIPVEGKLKLVGVNDSVWVEVVFGHALTRFVTLSVPRPTAGSYPLVVA